MRRLRARRGRQDRDPAELNITAFLNLMVILVPFLLITAVFSRMAIIQLNLPTDAQQPAEPEQQLRLEVIVRENALVVGDGQKTVARIPNTDQGYDIARLSQLMQQIKVDNPEVTEASVLLEPDTEYDILIDVMDAVRSVRQPDPDDPDKNIHVELFPEIALGDAPGGSS